MAPAPVGLLGSVVAMHADVSEVKRAIDAVPLESRLRACDEYGLSYEKFNKISRRAERAVSLIHQHARTESRRLTECGDRLTAKAYSPSFVRRRVEEAVARAVNEDTPAPSQVLRTG